MKVLVQTLMQITRVPVGGWSEGMIWEVGASSAAAAIQAGFDQTQRFLLDRMIFGGADTVAIGLRATLLEVAGARPVVKYLDPPSVGGRFGETDANFTALELLGVTPTGKRRVFRYAGMADDLVRNGKLFLSGLSGGNLNAMKRTLATTYIRGVDRTVAEVPVVLIVPATGSVATGVLTTSGNHGLQKGDIAQLLRCRNANGKNRSGFYNVVAVIDATTVQIAPWVESTNIEGSGTVRKYSPTFEQIGEVSFRGIVARKVGRAFGQSRARKFSKKAK